MADALEVIRRLQRQAARRGPGISTNRDAEPPGVDGAGLGPDSAGADGADDAAAGMTVQAAPVAVHGPLDATTPRDAQTVAAGLVVELDDGRMVARDLAAGAVLAWPLGVVDEDGRPLPYLRNGSLVVPFAAAEGWKWWRGGLGPEEVVARLEAAQGGDGA